MSTCIINTFLDQPHLKEQFNYYMADQLTEEQIKKAKAAFVQFDCSKSGSVACRYLGDMMKAIGRKYTDLELLDKITDIGVDPDGTLDFIDFLTMTAGCRLGCQDDMEDELIEAFRALDYGATGTITQEDIKAVLNNFEEKLSQQKIQDLLTEFMLGQGQETRIDYIEFIKFLLSK